MTDVMTELAGQRDEDLAKKAQESPLTPEGRYKFQVEAVTVRVGDKEFWDAEETQSEGAVVGGRRGAGQVPSSRLAPVGRQPRKRHQTPVEARHDALGATNEQDHTG